MSKIIAFENAHHAVNKLVNLPFQVFNGSWNSFLFCEPDWLFRPLFVDLAKRLLIAEKANECCMLNLTLTKEFKFDVADAFYVDANACAEDYKMRLFAGGGYAWISSVDHFVCSSNLGKWVVYCEKGEDVAIIAIQDKTLFFDLKPILHEVRATSAKVYIERPANGPYPAIRLTDHWKTEIMKNYRSSVDI